MRILLFFALLIIAAGGYLAYFNDASISLTLYQDIQVSVPIVPLLLGCVAAGLLLGLAGTIWHDILGLFGRMGAKRRRKAGMRVQQLFLEAERERLAGRSQKSAELYRKITKLNPEHTTAISRMGDLARAKGAYKEAVSLHRLAFRLDPEHPKHRLAMIHDYLNMEAFESAVQSIEAGLSEDPKNQALLMCLRTAHTGQGDWDAAVIAQQRVIKTPMEGLDSRAEKQCLNGYRYEAAVRQLADGKTEQAKNSLNSLLREAPEFSPAHITLAELSLRDGNIATALKQLINGYDQTRDESFLPLIENLYIVHMEDPREALRYFSSLTERDPGNLRLRYYLGRIYFRLEMIDDALHVLTQVEQQVDHFAELTELMGRINLRRGETHQALAKLGSGEAAGRYTCRHCSMPSDGWQARCGSCGQWGEIGPQLSIHPEQNAAPAGGPALLPAPN